MRILVTGGAGYIGSVAVKKLLEKGNSVVVVDNLSKGGKELIDERAKFYEIDLIDIKSLEEIFIKEKIDSIIHFAAYKSVEESMNDAIKYSSNLIGSINILNLAVKYKIKKIIFSSTAAVYGNSNNILTENSITDPINFYGFSKLEFEKILKWYNKIHKINFICLRYFNVAGDLLNYIDNEPKNIFPIIMEVIKGKRKEFTIFGDDYSTPDGTCIRDYVDVRDLVDAHILALNNSYNGVLNLGSGKGHSVKQLIEMFKKVSGKDFEVIIKNRRLGDPPLVVASNTKAKEILGWEPKYSLQKTIESIMKVSQ